jgi:hypothetical protein
MSAGFFNKLKAGAHQMGEDFTGPDYRYQDFIKTPKEQGMSGAGNFDALAKNIGGIINYSNILTKGTGPAKIGNNPLGNKFFLKTAGKCAPAENAGTRCDAKTPCPSTAPKCFKNQCWKPVKNWKGGDGALKAQRWLFIDNTTKGKLPFIRGESSFKGIVPGMLENIMEMNPIEVLTAFGGEATPLCKKVKSKVTRVTKVRGRNKYYYENWNKYVALTDLPENFANRFQNLENKPILHLYNTGFGLLMVYILFCFLQKK